MPETSLYWEWFRTRILTSLHRYIEANFGFFVSKLVKLTCFIQSLYIYLWFNFKKKCRFLCCKTCHEWRRVRIWLLLVSIHVCFRCFNNLPCPCAMTSMLSVKFGLILRLIDGISKWKFDLRIDWHFRSS